MVKRSMLAALAVYAAASVLGGCATPADPAKEPVRNAQGQLVDPKTGIVLPGQGPGGGGGY